jgi:hypothetical protein
MAVEAGRRIGRDHVAQRAAAFCVSAPVAGTAMDNRMAKPTLTWLNAVENFFSKMTRQRIRRGVFRSIADLQAAINAYLAEHNANPKPFVWT